MTNDKVREALEKLLIAVAGSGPGSEPNVYADYDKLTKLVRECRDALALDPWQPIETAPKDGSKILLYGVEQFVNMPEPLWKLSNMLCGHWFDNGWVFCHLDDNSIVFWSNIPTHWQPLPNPPEKK